MLTRRSDCVPLFLGLGGDIDLPDGDVALPEFKDHTPNMFTERLSTLLEMECVKMENASSTRKVTDCLCTLLGLLVYSWRPHLHLHLRYALWFWKLLYP